MGDQMDIVYIEASTAKAWKIDKFPERAEMSDKLDITFFPVYSFDKQSTINEVINSDKKPDIIILQECSVYFPGDLSEYKGMVMSWVDKIRNSNIKPMLATTVPPASSVGFVLDVKNIVKQYILGRDTQFTQVVEFNEWLREYASSNSITLIDLEHKLRQSSENRHMKEEYNAGDGIHVNKQAYEQLDLLFKEVISKELK